MRGRPGDARLLRRVRGNAGERSREPFNDRFGEGGGECFDVQALVCKGDAMEGKVTYHQQVSYCGKPRCRRCREGIGHGPYWYSYRTINGRTVRTYIGKEPPPSVLAAQAETDGSAPSEFANTLLRLYVLGQFRLEQRVTAPGALSDTRGMTSGASPHVPLAPGAASIAVSSRAPAATMQWEQVTEASLQHQRVRSLLSCLVSSPGRKLGREQVMYMLWPELDFETASHRLDRAVHSLRQVFEPGLSRPSSSDSRLLLTEHSTLILAEQAQFWVDADAFEQLIARGRAAKEDDPGKAERLLEEAMHLYLGDFMPGSEVIDCVTSRREALRRSWISLLLELADLRREREALPGALDVLDRLLVADPANEAAVQRMMVLLAQMGRRGEALQVYQRFAAVLTHEYHIEPLAQTRALYAEVRDGLTPGGGTLGNVPGDVPPAGTPPSPPTPRVSEASARAGATFTDDRNSIDIVNIDDRNNTSIVNVGPGGRDGGIRDDVSDVHAIMPAHMHIGRTQQGPLVGRGEEMTRLRELLNLTAGMRRQRLAGEKRSAPLTPLDLNGQRRPQCVMLMGDVGIGKTRLAEEAAREAKRHNWAVAWCRAYTQESNVPYRLWTETLRKAMTQGYWQREEVTRRPLIYQPLRSLLPELQDLLPQSIHMLPPPPEQEQLRLRESTRALLATICEGTTLLIVLDDMQWADSSSCEMLTYLVRQMRGLPIMFLCTCRDSELPPDHHLRPLLTDLQREQAVETIPVRPLDDREMHQLLAHLPAPVADRVSERASGNPFFAEELARELASGEIELDPNQAALLPDTIQAVLDLRLARISERCRHILERGAVLGGAFQFDAIRDMASVSEEEMLDLLEEGLQARMLTEEGSGMDITYHFWHPLLQTYLYEHLSHARRASLHRRAAQALQNLYAGKEAEKAAEIADHLEQGGAAPSLVARYAELAADHAYSLSAYAAAEKYYRLLLAQLGELAPDAPQDERLRRAFVLERLGESAMIVGKYEDARKFYESALAVRSQGRAYASAEERAYEAQIEALICCEIGQIWRYLGDRNKARESFKKGEEVLSGAGVIAGPAWARIRYQEGHTLWLEGNLSEALTMANEALTLSETLPAQTQVTGGQPLFTLTQRILNGDPINLGRMYLLVGTIEVASSQNTKAMQHLNIALNIFEQHDYQREIAIVCSNLGDIYLKKAEYGLAQTVFQRAFDIDKKIGDDPNTAVVLINLGVLAARLGKLVEAEDWYRQALTLTEQVSDLFYISLFSSYVATALIEQGKLDEAQPLLIQALKISRSKQISPCIGFALVALGQLRLARALDCESGLSRARRNRPTRLFIHLLARARTTLRRALTFDGLEADTLLEGQLLLARIALLLGERENARELAMKALEQARASELVWLQARAQCLLGQALMAGERQEEREEAESYFRQALAIFARTGMRLEYARAALARASALLQISNASAPREQALEDVRAARQTFADCHAALDLRTADQLLADAEATLSLAAVRVKTRKQRG